MTDEKRLEEIQKSVSNMPIGMPKYVLTWRGWESVKIIFEDDYKYLIEQAKRAFKNAEDLEDMDKQLTREKLIKNAFQQGIEEQSKRIKELEHNQIKTAGYKQAIEKASDELAWGDAENAIYKARKILNKALKGVKR